LLNLTGELPESCRFLIEGDKGNDLNIKITARASAVEAGAGWHDLGKVFLPVSLVEKGRRLDQEELGQIRVHPWWGYMAMLNDRNFDLLSAQISLYHHENWDGSGYPFQMAGKEIPLEAMIVHVADVFDALREQRCYKSSYSEDAALDYIVSQSGKMFDPDVVEAFIALKKGNRFAVDEEYPM
jgi:HD-GYP domain-containing protein (c-di-GMP phosphodiesterase class II)